MIKIIWIIRTLIKLLIFCIGGLICILSSIFLFHTKTLVGFSFGMIVLLFGTLTFIGLFANKIKFKYLKRILLIYLVSILTLSIFVYLYIPSGVNPMISPVHNLYTKNISFNRFSLFNIIPEIDQLQFGLFFIPYLDSTITKQQAQDVSFLCMSIYREMGKHKYFHNLGSAAQYSFLDMIGKEYNRGHYYLYKPKKMIEKSLPILVFFHGGLGNFKGYLWLLSQLAEKHKMVIICPSFGTGNWRLPEATDAVMEAVEQVKRNMDIDPKRIYLAGLSNGGIGVTRAFDRIPDFFNGLIYISPVMDYDITDHPSFIKKMKGTNVLVISGAKDRRIPVDYVNSRIRMWQIEGIDVISKIYKDEDHFLLFSQSESVLETISHWLLKIENRNLRKYKK